MNPNNFTKDVVNASYGVTRVKNKVGSIVCKVLAIIFLVLSIILFVFINWVVGLVFLGLAIVFYFLSKLGKVANKFNEKSQQKFNESMDAKTQQNSEEVL